LRRITDGGHEESANREVVALVGRDGSVIDCGQGEGAEQLRSHTLLVDYAAAFLASDRSSARFFWQTRPRRWLRITIERSVSQQGARVTVEPCVLPAGLTPRELDVLSLLTGGLSNRQIADRLCGSIRTVSTHVAHILAKLGQQSRAGAAAVAAERGWIRMPVPGGGDPLRDLAVGSLQPNGVREDRRRFSAGVHLPPPRRQPLLIGSALPLSGPAAADGLEMLNGSALAVAELNSHGGIAGRRIEQLVADTDILSVEGVERALQELLDAGVDAITSGYVFREDAAREVAARSRTPYLHSMTSESQAQMVSDNHGLYRGIFQVCPTERHYGSGFIRFLDEIEGSKGWRPHRRTIAFVETSLPSGQMVNDLTVAAAGRSGWQIGSVDTVAPIGADWRGVISSLERIDPAAVMITQFLASELADFQREIVRRLPQVLVYAVYAPSVPEFLELAGAAAEGLLWSTVTGTYSDSIGRQFRNNYEKAFGRPPGRSHAGIAYDEIHLLAQAWYAVADPTDFVAVGDQLRRLRYRGVNGAYYLDNPGQSGLVFPDATPDPSLAQAHLVFQVQDGTHRIVSPPPYAEAAFRWPLAGEVSG
jgi:branched-chain amino acid transport system substrate-binding protein